MATPVPAAAIRLIQEFEGCERRDRATGLIHAYPDPHTQAEPWTIGWGTTVYPDGRPVGPHDRISQAEADRLLIETLQHRFWQPLATSIPHWSEMHEAMRAALCSFAYNLGSHFQGAPGFRTISSCLAEKRWEAVPEALLLYVNPGSSVEAGLRRRRQAEGQLWQEGLAQLSATAAAPPVQVLEAITATFLKKERRDSTELAPHQLVAVESGRQWTVERLLTREGHAQQVRLAFGAGDWWIFAPHWRTLAAAGDGSAPARAETSAAASATAGSDRTIPAGSSGVRDLAVPHLSQLDNRFNPHGSCNVTCVAMCLHYLGMPRQPGSQLEDALYQRLLALGRSRHNPYDLKFLIESHAGYRDIFRENGSLAAIRASIDAGHPVILHGYFTSFGHLVVVRGYDARGLLVNDPYGEWFSDGYDTSRSGERLHYSYGLIARTCSPESRSDPRHLWMHTVLRV